MKKEDKEHIILRWQLMWFRISLIADEFVKFAENVHMMLSCNDILEKLEKEGIISAEGVIDSYLLCKHAEELFGKSYLKEHNIVLDDDKKEAKICKKGS